MEQSVTPGEGVFIDQTTGHACARAAIPPDQLPESFEAETTLEIAGEKWRVCAATPMTRAEYLVSRSLTLELCRLQLMSPGEILFSLPTIGNWLPAVDDGTSKLGKRVLEVTEDDWRQVELIARSWEAAMAQELSAIRRVLDEERVGVGFRRLHLRRAIENPLRETRLSLHELLEAFPNAAPFEGVGVHGLKGLVVEGYAFSAPAGVTLYGTAPGGCLHSIALAPRALGASAELEVLGRWMLAHELVLVDWVGAESIEAGELDAWARRIDSESGPPSPS